MFKNKCFIYVLSYIFYLNSIAMAFLHSPSAHAAIKAKDLPKITKEFKPYYDCMEKICNTGEGIASCYDMKEDIKIVKLKTGAKLKEGTELLRYANAICGSKIKKSPNKELYKQGFKTLVYESYLDADYLKSIASLERDGNFDFNFKKLKSCMFEVCNPGYEEYVDGLTLKEGQEPPAPNYEGCWKVYKTQSYLRKCDHILKKSSTPFALKGEFFNFLSDTQVKSCLTMKGAKFDEKKNECSFEVELKRGGKSSKMRILLGEQAECSQHYFNIDFGRRKEKTRSWWNYVKGGVKIVVGAVITVVCAVGGVVTSWTGVGALAGGAGVVAGVSIIVSGAADVGKGAVKDSTKKSWKNRGACYINGNKICDEGETMTFRSIMK